MIFTTIKTTPLGVDVELPKAVTGTPPKAAPALRCWWINRGAFYVSGKIVSGKELEAKVVERLKVNPPDLFVIVKADKQVRYEHVVAALDHIRGVGGYRLGGLAVERDS